MIRRRRRSRVCRLTPLLLGIAILAPASAGAATFSNPASIVVGTDYRGVPYPSVIAVSGLTGDVISARATLHAISYPIPEDLDVMLVGPDGSKTLLMSDACLAGTLSGATFTFDDAASAALPNASCVGLAGSFKPTNYGGSDEFFFPPAPQGPTPA
jgi:large repetitive protein